MAGKPGFTYSLYPIPDSLEDVGAAYETLALHYAKRGEFQMAGACKRACRAMWLSAATIRVEQQKKSDALHEQSIAS